MERREHSAGELFRKLSVRGYNVTDIRNVIDELKDQGLQSDDRFTEVFVHSRTEKGYGPVRIMQDLRKRSIGDDLIHQFIDVNDAAWGQQADRVREKRFGHNLPTDYKEKAKQSRFLQYRGFTTDQIRNVINEGGV